MSDSAQRNTKPLFAVMGATGAGKSTFIKLLTNDKEILIGHKQQSETIDIKTSTYVDATGRPVELIDTPWFDDSRGVTDTDILQKIVDYLEPEKDKERKVNGVFFLHRISDPRVGGVSRKNIRMFYLLCGEKNLKNVRIVTTNWGRVTKEEGDEREEDLKTGAFKPLIDAGAVMCRHENNSESAQRTVSELIPLTTEAVTMKIQEELHAGKRLADTDAGKALTAEMEVMRKKGERDLAELRKEMELAAKTRDDELKAELEREREALRKKMACMDDDRKALERTLAEHHQERGQRKRLYGMAADLLSERVGSMKVDGN